MFSPVNFGLLGPIVSNRFFEITGPYTGCQTDIGWLVVTSHPVCPWDRRSPQPSIQYSKQHVASRMENYGNFDIEIFSALYSVDRVPITNKKICCSGITSPHAIRDTRFRRLSSFFLPDVVKDVKKMNEHLQKNDSGDRFKIS